MFLGALIFFAHFFNSIFDRIKIPNVLLLLIIGIISGFFIDKELFFGEVGRVFTTITLVIILFESGTSLRFNELKSAVTSASLITIFNFIGTLVLVSGIASLLTSLNLIESIFLGAIVGGTSSAVVVPILSQLKLGKKASTVLLLESAFSDVLCLVVGLAALEAIKAGQIEISIILNSLWQSFLFAALIGIFGGVIWSLLLKFIRGLNNSMFTTLAFVLLVYGIVELLGLNGGIAALSFGIILGNAKAFGNSWVWKKVLRIEAAEFTKGEQDFFAEIVFILQTYFFVYVGIVIEFGSVLTYMIAIMLVSLIILIRPVGIKLFVKKDVNPKERTIMSILSPKGLVPAVLASIPLQLGIASGQTIAEIGYAIVLLSIIVCSILIAVSIKNPYIFNRIYRDKIKRSFIKEKVNIKLETDSELKLTSGSNNNTFDDFEEENEENKSNNNPDNLD